VKTAVVLGILLLLLVLNILASVRLLRSEVVTPAQKAAWMLLIWLVPLAGSILAFQVSSLSTSPNAPIDGSLDAHPSLTPGLDNAGSSYTGGAHQLPHGGASVSSDS
jgi:hypothetical protein